MFDTGCQVNATCKTVVDVKPWVGRYRRAPRISGFFSNILESIGSFVFCCYLAL